MAMQHISDHTEEIKRDVVEVKCDVMEVKRDVEEVKCLWHPMSCVALVVETEFSA